ncbi:MULTISPECIES: cell division protein FtsA [unclassified Thermotoga]|uniref:cell division protein FtsA n=1 Tax=unclassified Thermotoga TaxID=2631113 RepID=UPI000280E7E5|nr:MULTISPECIES: cell division protein FtsA [unclassified Thermotoga]AIY87058.1 cell division protein FtsA [Thermotoga sp. 2812B]EJX25775.1 cell division protein FtsA [Thermotoga sp. EMP]
MIFALDVGTRKIAGLIVVEEKGTIRIVDSELIEHKTRTMFDGQVHDVLGVAETVKEVKERLESRNEIELKEVAVALAGRFLKTQVGEAELDFSKTGHITREDVMKLEIEAVTKAQESVEEDFFCVGYSVVEYRLDGMWMKKLEGHRGGKAYVKVVSAFLPVHVVDSLMRVLETVGLTPVHVTLEPIAAMDLTVPEDLRYLNIALVDVGAGTSDIAISKEGTVVAYGMIPMAGDEITEAIGKKFLLDFQTAEHVKRTVFSEERVKVKNILDREIELNAREVSEAIKPIVDQITTEISTVVTELNGGAPSVVMVVGGGAKVPGFVESLARKMDLPLDRVSLKSVESTGLVEDLTGKVKGSEYITPVGIAYSAMRNRGSVFSQVFVNGVPVKLMGGVGRYSVMQVLIQAGYRFSSLVGGEMISFELNGKTLLRPKRRTSVKIFVNGEEANLSSRVKHGDRIDIQTEEEKTPLRIKDLVKPVKVKLPDGGVEEVFPEIVKNGTPVPPDADVEEGDVVSFPEKIKISEIKSKISYGKTRIVVNGEEKWISLVNFDLLKGGVPLKDDEEVPLGEEIDLVEKGRKKLEEALEVPHITVSFNGELKKIPLKILHRIDEERVELKDFKPMVIDLLKDLKLDGLRDYELLKNGRRAMFTELLEDGDVIEFRIKK